MPTLAIIFISVFVFGGGGDGRVKPTKPRVLVMGTKGIDFGHKRDQL